MQVDPGKLYDSLPSDIDEEGRLEEHPAAREQQLAVEESRARLAALRKLSYPKFLFQAASYGRGTGARADGSTGGALSGLGPNIHNWGVGFTVSFPLLEQPALQAKRELETHHARGEEARYALVLRELDGRPEKAKAMLSGAWRAAMQAPARLQSALVAEQQASARYKAGLSSIAEVAEAQRLLAQAEVDNALSHLQVWRALLAVAASKGDLREFLERAK